MSNRLLEDCITLEANEETKWTKYIVVDPFAINMKDLIHAKPGKVALVGIRRPFWGLGDLDRFIHKIEL